MDFVGGINGEPIRLDQSRLSIILSCYNVDILLVSFISFSDIFYDWKILRNNLFHRIVKQNIIVYVSNFWNFKIFSNFQSFRSFLKISNFQRFNFLNFQISGIPNFQNLEILNFQTYEFPMLSILVILNSWNFNFFSESLDFQRSLVLVQTRFST